MGKISSKSSKISPMLILRSQEPHNGIQVDAVPQIAHEHLDIGETCGVGAVGLVRKAKWKGKEVALKTLLAGGDQKEFLNELANLSKLQHPCLVKLYALAVGVDKLSLLLEYVPSGSLYDLLHTPRIVTTKNEKGIKITTSQYTSISWALKYRFATDITAAMVYMNSQNYLHRDLKTSNVLVASLSPAAEVTAKLCDFGASRKQAMIMTSDVGTLAYKAPELFESMNYTEKIDVYSFAIILWEMVTRKLPFDGAQFGYSIIKAVQKGIRPKIPVECPADLAHLIRHCWQGNPEDRPSFSEIHRRLKEIGINSLHPSTYDDEFAVPTRSPRPEVDWANPKADQFVDDTVGWTQFEDAPSSYLEQSEGEFYEDDDEEDKLRTQSNRVIPTERATACFANNLNSDQSNELTSAFFNNHTTKESQKSPSYSSTWESHTLPQLDLTRTESTELPPNNNDIIIQPNEQKDSQEAGAQDKPVSIRESLPQNMDLPTQTPSPARTVSKKNVSSIFRFAKSSSVSINLMPPAEKISKPRRLSAETIPLTHLDSLIKSNTDDLSTIRNRKQHQKKQNLVQKSRKERYFPSMCIEPDKTEDVITESESMSPPDSPREDYDLPARQMFQNNQSKQNSKKTEIPTVDLPFKSLQQQANIEKIIANPVEQDISTDEENPYSPRSPTIDTQLSSPQHLEDIPPDSQNRRASIYKLNSLEYKSMMNKKHSSLPKLILEETGISADSSAVENSLRSALQKQTQEVDRLHQKIDFLQRQLLNEVQKRRSAEEKLSRLRNTVRTRKKLDVPNKKSRERSKSESRGTPPIPLLPTTISTVSPTPGSSGVSPAVSPVVSPAASPVESPRYEDCSTTVRLNSHGRSRSQQHYTGVEYYSEQLVHTKFDLPPDKPNETTSKTHSKILQYYKDKLQHRKSKKYEAPREIARTPCRPRALTADSIAHSLLFRRAHSSSELSSST